MRMMHVAGGGLLLMATAMAYYVFFDLRPAHISELVPDDFAFGTFYGSANKLRQLYEAPHQRKDVDPAELRIGDPVNNPGLAGISYGEPAGSFWTPEGEEVFLIPCVDYPAFKEAFDQEREDIQMRAPKRVAENYLSLSKTRASARHADENELITRAVRYPLAVAGHPKDGAMLRLMLASLFLRESPKKLPGVPLAAREVRNIPPGLASMVARECNDLLIGFPQIENVSLPVRVEVEATLSQESALGRSAALADELDLTGIAATFPFNTVLLVGAVLDGKGWKDWGLPIPVGDSAFVAGIVETKHHRRRFTLLLAARPRDPAVLAALAASGHAALLDDPEKELAATTLLDQKTEVKTSRLDAPPAWLATVLRADAEKSPPVYLSKCVENGIWYCAIGSQAEGAVRRALACLRSAPELGLQRSKPVAEHRGFLKGPHAGLVLVTASGLKAFSYAMPLLEVASLGQPASVTAILDIDGRARVELRIPR